jgi:hypothetical protein
MTRPALGNLSNDEVRHFQTLAKTFANNRKNAVVPTVNSRTQLQIATSAQLTRRNTPPLLT